MNTNNTSDTIQQKPLRLLPGIIIVILQWLLWLVLPVIFPGDLMAAVGVLGGMVCGLGVFVWWAFFSGASRIERWGGVVLMIIALVGTSRLVDKSIGTGMQGMMFFSYAIPVLCLAFIIWAVVSRNLSERLRQITMILTILVACGIWFLFRSDGITGLAGADFTWRWAPTAEERLLAQTGDEKLAFPSAIEVSVTEAAWPGFRGSNRDGVVSGLQIKTDWSQSPPVELWRRPIGPGCSSCAIRGNLLYTQEQRGEDEIVSCYNLKTGDPIWRHSNKARFWDSHAGAGPRSTPTLSDSCVYTLGATGILNALNAYDGTLIWSHNVVSDTDAKHSGWAFTGSPLVVDDVVIVATSGIMAGYDLATGNNRWIGPDGGLGYSSPHPVTIGGITQVLLMSENGAISVAPLDGTVLWKHTWGIERILQPALIAEGDFLFNDGGLTGMRRISVKKESNDWAIKEIWTSKQLKPNFNDFVVHKGHAYGFNGPSLACIDIENGERKWRGGRYGGQIILLADQDLLLVLSEKGELALVSATPDQFKELTSIQAINGKTWNHPSLAGEILVVRNTEEMAAFQLPLMNE
ncbi:PQQ-binding-like beta-propeller repeat protein [Bacteroidota bacterium]